MIVNTLPRYSQPPHQGTSRHRRRHGFDPWVGKIPWRRKWQYSCLENPTFRGTWRTIVHGVERIGHDLATKPPPPPRLERSVAKDSARLCKHVEITCFRSCPVSFWKRSVVAPPSSKRQVALLGFPGALVSIVVFNTLSCHTYSAPLSPVG